MGRDGKLQPTLTNVIFVGATGVTWTHGVLPVAVLGKSIRLIVNSLLNPRQLITPDLLYVALSEESIAIFPAAQTDSVCVFSVVGLIRLLNAADSYLCEYLIRSSPERQTNREICRRP